MQSGTYHHPTREELSRHAITASARGRMGHWKGLSVEAGGQKREVSVGSGSGCLLGALGSEEGLKRLASPAQDIH